jgi:hypothetical protein
VEMEGTRREFGMSNWSTLNYMYFSFHLCVDSLACATRSSALELTRLFMFC